MTAIVFIHCIRHRTTWGPLGQAFLRQGLVAYVMVSSLDLIGAVVLLMPDKQKNGIAVLRTPTNCVIACRLILMFRRRADPTATTQLQNESKNAQDQIDQLAAEQYLADDSSSDRKGPIEGWD